LTNVHLIVHNHITNLAIETNIQIKMEPGSIIKKTTPIPKNKKMTFMEYMNHNQKGIQNNKILDINLKV